MAYGFMGCITNLNYLTLRKWFCKQYVASRWLLDTKWLGSRCLSGTYRRSFGERPSAPFRFRCWHPLSSVRRTNCAWMCVHGQVQRCGTCCRFITAHGLRWPRRSLGGWQSIPAEFDPLMKTSRYGRQWHFGRKPASVPERKRDGADTGHSELSRCLDGLAFGLQIECKTLGGRKPIHPPDCRRCCLLWDDSAETAVGPPGCINRDRVGRRETLLDATDFRR